MERVNLQLELPADAGSGRNGLWLAGVVRWLREQGVAVSGDVPAPADVNPGASLSLSGDSGATAADPRLPTPEGMPIAAERMAYLRGLAGLT